MSHLRGNRARRLAPTARQTKLSVFVFAVQRVSCVCTDDRVRRSMIAALWLAICVLWDVFIYFISPGSENNLQGVWLLILPSLWDETGGAIAVTKTERLHDGRRRRREMIHSGVFGGVAYLSWEKKTAVMASLCRLSSVPCCLSSGEINICGPVLILPLCMTQFDFG